MTDRFTAWRRKGSHVASEIVSAEFHIVRRTPSGYTYAKRDGKFAEVRFKATDIGLIETSRANPWRESRA